MNLITKFNYLKLLNRFQFYSTATVEHKSPKSELDAGPVKKSRPFSKDMLIGRFNINILEYPEINNNESLDQTVAVSKEVDKLLKSRDSLDRQTILSRLCESGIMGVSVPGVFIEDHYSWMMVTRVIESLATDIDFTLYTYLPQTIVCQSLVLGGTDSQKVKYLMKLARGEIKGCVAMTERLSDVVSDDGIETTARLDIETNSWIISGKKTRVVNYEQSDIIIVFAKTPDGEVAPFIVDSKSEGISQSHDHPTDLLLTNVKVPHDHILSITGLKLPRHLATIHNIGISAMCATLTRSLITLVNEFVSNRRIFGKPLSQYETIQEYLAQLTADSYSTETGAYFIAGTLDYNDDIDFFIESTLAKIHGLDAVRRCVDLSMKIVGINYLEEPRFKTLHEDAGRLLRSQGATDRSRWDISKEPVAYMCEQQRLHPHNVLMKMKMFLGGYEIIADYQDKYLANSFKYNLHPRVGGLADPVYREYATMAKILKKMSLRSPEVLKEELCLGILSVVLAESLVMMAVLSRASRSISIGLRNHDHEVALAEMVAKESCQRIKSHVAMLADYSGNARRCASAVEGITEVETHFKMAE